MKTYVGLTKQKVERRWGSHGQGYKGQPVYEANGKMYKSYELVELSSVKGLKPVDITTRINHQGWSVERAITQQLKKRDQLFEYNGKKYTSKQLAEMSQVEGLTYHDITDRINRCGWSVHDAITKDKRK